MDDLLAAYDDRLRGPNEVRSARWSERLGPLRLAEFGGGFGFITARDLPAEGLDALVEAALGRLRARDPAYQ